MAHLRTEARRRFDALVDQCQRALITHNMAVAFQARDGTWQGDAHDIETPPALRLVGGEFDPLSGTLLADAPARAAVTLTVQAQQLPALASEAQFLAVFGGQRSGKTYVGREIALCTLLRPGSIVFYLLPKFGKSGFVLDGLLDVLSAQGWIARSNANEHRYELINGSILQVFSAADKRSEETFLGGECDLAVLEEFREMPERVFAKLFSRIISRNGRMVIVTSPEAGHMIEEIDRGEWTDRVAFEVHRLDVRKNFFIYESPPEGDGEQAIVKVARKLYDERRYRRDVLGENVAETGADYYNWDPEVHTADEVPGILATEYLWHSDPLWLSRDPAWSGEGSVRPDPELRHVRLVGLDFGAAIMSAVECVLTVDQLIDPDTAAFSGLKPTELNYYNATLVVLKEHVKEDTSVTDFVPNVLQKAGLTPERAVIFCDPSGNARDHVVGQSPVDMLRDVFGYRVYHKPGGTLRIPGIWAIRERLQLRRLVVIRKGAPGLVKDMGKVRSIGRAPKDVSRDPDGHRPDALRYVVDNLFPVRDLFADAEAFKAALQAHGGRVD